MADILVLEDKVLDLNALAVRVGRISIDLVTNSRDFRQYVDEGNTPKLWFLDDRVPDEPYVAGGDHPSLIANCKYLIGRQPEAEIYCTSTFPDDKTMDFLKEHRIGLINKNEIIEAVHKRFPRSL